MLHIIVFINFLTTIYDSRLMLYISWINYELKIKLKIVLVLVFFIIT